MHTSGNQEKNTRQGWIQEVTSSVVKFGIDFNPSSFQCEFASVAKAAVKVEKYDFDSFWVPDRSIDPLTALAAAAVNTKKVRLGTCVLIPSYRYPAVLARDLSTLDNISGGRLIVGVGAGESLKRWGIPSRRRVSRFLEMIKLLKRLWTESTVSCSGPFYMLENFSLGIKPVQKPHPPIWIGASGPRMMRITATHGNGWFGPQVTSEIYREALNKLRQMAEKQGRDLEEIAPAHLPFTSISLDHDSALKLIEPAARWFLVWAAQPPSRLGELLGYKETWINEEDVPLEAIEKCFIFGTPDECIEKIEEFIRAGARHFVLGIRAADEKRFLDSIKLYADRVIPHFKGNT
jgi:phthiodiolone/phenolphthiodiolone dimycocerosates ketoreductase